jgi:isoquinoline 1-oxidoreductase subunit alpha
MIRFMLNGKSVEIDEDPQKPLLWVLRDSLGLTGTKYGCGQALCGACTVHVEGEAARACQTALGDIAGKSVLTIEGASGEVARAVQDSWIALDVPQCGYCQSGQVMTAIALLSKNRKPDDADIDDAMNGNICRCATYHRIRKAVHEASRRLGA